MQPFSYTSLKIVHDRMIQEAMQRHCLYSDQATHQPRRRLVFGAFRLVQASTC